MSEYPVSIAGVFLENENNDDILCSICFCSSASDISLAEQIELYIKTTVFPSLAKIIINSDPISVSSKINKFAKKVSLKFNVHCFGVLNDYHLAVFPKRSPEEK